MREISKEAAEVLAEVITHEDEPDYWQARFEGLSHKDSTILRGCFKELVDNNFIVVLWAVDYVVVVEILKDGYLYEQHLEEARKESEKAKMQMTAASTTVQTPSEYDVFLSHASADKPYIVEELYKSLSKLGVSIFYDKESLKWGDNWKQRILDGTKKAEFAIIVISENFFDREWTEKELSEFLNRQKNGQKLILPIIHNITTQQLRDKYPRVADIQAIDSSKYSCDEIALLFAEQLIKRLKEAKLISIEQ